jgi:hypothetical protein
LFLSISPIFKVPYLSKPPVLTSDPAPPEGARERARRGFGGRECGRQEAKGLINSATPKTFKFIGK